MEEIKQNSDTEIPEKRNSNCTVKHFTNIPSSNSQICEKQKKGVKAISADDLKIVQGENEDDKIEEYLNKYKSNVFSNKHSLYLYCKYVILYYGNELVNKKDVDKLNFEIINGGITNILVKVEHSLEKKTYLIRLYGPKTSEIINRGREKIISHILNDKNISKKIFVFFPNGRIEEFMEGYALSKEEIKNPNFQKEIAKKLKILHDIELNDDIYETIKKLQTEDCIYYNDLNNNEFDKSNNRSSFLWGTIWKYFNLLYEEKSKPCEFNSKGNILKLIDFDSLKKTISEVEKICKEKKSPIVLCHCDLLSSNFINKTDNTICLIDFEYSCPMERAFDIANHFNEYAGFNCEWNLIPTRDEEYNFIKHYLNTDNNQIINKLIDEIQPFYLISHIHWALWSLLQGMRSSIDFDFINYGMTKLTASTLSIFRSKITSQQ
ncbi:ethanolamine kinase, putative [Plasmodium berghei]|uniref:ethanolamine kinase n=2 Tax=Plasmodium berghei TaxID=5821 RepID=A0A509APY9_PLABA|nr:ethanolamine kinase, putative [Plasmodium berghei ANKA]CXI43267.1 ethanolamine kinase, putative [Plasmodium berghei]SCM22280.1 ethanolamine kinase, putative [Plasmodium berghei]SCN25373.1 ethanolamine kinase, putative [Plasmodium berghei]SCO60340.1 ethanolamine kinase, putative [Plasmodium berghei]SCO62063.1 ethanolamine kinase, putative [Plasmodium berghei]|eukprot:XP_034421587.1 ethanolamine kinase, putative [Plasmodium berghei ANKA]